MKTIYHLPNVSCLIRNYLSCLLLFFIDLEKSRVTLGGRSSEDKLIYKKRKGMYVWTNGIHEAKQKNNLYVVKKYEGIILRTPHRQS